MSERRARTVFGRPCFGRSCFARPWHFGRLAVAILAVIATATIHGGLAQAQTGLYLKRSYAPVKKRLGEPQVRLNCKASTLKLSNCRSPISKRLWRWINGHAYCFAKAHYAATGRYETVTSAKLHCNLGMCTAPRLSSTGGRKSQHSYCRACDGTLVTVNGVRYNYLKAIRADRGKKGGSNRDLRFYLAFLDCWGPTGPGLTARPNVRLTIDRNRGVRDWREDPRGHSSHFHLSKPCYWCMWGKMAYE